MLMEVDIPWLGGQNTMGKGDQNTMDNSVNIPWTEGQNTMGRGDKIPWVSGSLYHG
jgi:hypothetical protein